MFEARTVGGIPALVAHALDVELAKHRLFQLHLVLTESVLPQLVHQLADSSPAFPFLQHSDAISGNRHTEALVSDDDVILIARHLEAEALYMLASVR